jgi:hypothetical protein
MRAIERDFPLTLVTNNNVLSGVRKTGRVNRRRPRSSISKRVVRLSGLLAKDQFAPNGANDSHRDEKRARRDRIEFEARADMVLT